MNIFALLSIVFISVFVGFILCLFAIWYIFIYYSKKEPVTTNPTQQEVQNITQFILPKSLLDVLSSSETPKKETCIALNLLFHFLFHELRNSVEVRSWFLKKLSIEFDELLTRSTTGKLIDKITIRELDLGSRFPTITGISIQTVQLHPTKQHIEILDLSLDLQYEGGFQLGTNAKLLLGATALVSVKVTHLSGRARLRFTRQPYSHWSFTFYTEPSLELQVDSQFQGRPIPQVTSIIVNQIRKAVKKKHTFPQFKLRYKPFFQPPSHIFNSLHDDTCFATAASTSLPSTVLNVCLVECTRLHAELLSGDVYCTLAVDEAPWFELVRKDSMAVMTVDLILKKKPSQPLGVTFKPDPEGNRVCVDHIDIGSPAFEAKLRKCDILLCIQGTKVNSLSHASKLLKSAGNRFSLRVERKRSILQHQDLVVQEELPKTPNSPSTIRRRSTIEQQQQLSQSLQSETESSGSSNTSPSNSPAKKSNSNLQPAEETSAHFTRKRSSAEDNLSGIQIYRTKELPVCVGTKELPVSADVTFNESVTFHVGDNIRYFNFGVWSINSNSSEEKCKDILLGHLSIPLSQVIEKCVVTGLGHFIKKWQLQEPCISSKSHALTDHSGFEPGLCYGDVLLSFIMIPDQTTAAFTNSASTSASVNSSPRASPSLRGDLELATDQIIRAESPVREIPIPGSLALNSEDSPVHDFVRTHFTRATQCDFCSKKIWLKDAVQCRTCRMTCHKKCVTKCQAAAVCVATDELSESNTNSQGPSPTKAPEIITTSFEADSPVNETVLVTQVSKRSLGGLLASVASAAHARGIKRVGSASNLAPPGDGTPSQTSGSVSISNSTRSLPHSPQLSPSVSRKTSLADASLFELPGELAALDEAADEFRIEEALETLLQRHYDNEDIMTVAKDTGKHLYSGLPGRKDKINKLISKLKVAMDREMQIQETLEAEAEDVSDRLRRAELLSHSEQRVQAITVLLLHCCAGLQHVQDTEEEEQEKEQSTNYIEAMEASDNTTAMI